MKKLSVLGLLLIMASVAVAMFSSKRKAYRHNGIIVRSQTNLTDCRLIAGTSDCETIVTDGSGENDTGQFDHDTTTDNDLNFDND